eukprot:753116-Hanusia_phi.AAC.2
MECMQEPTSRMKVISENEELAIDVNTVNPQQKLRAELDRLSSSETVMPVYQRLCDYISREDIKPLLEDIVCSKTACRKLFRMPDSEHDKR